MELDPSRGSELRKTRSCVVLSYDGIRRLPVRLVVPVTQWQPGFVNQPWKALLVPDDANGLTKDNAADMIQTRCADLERFANYVGELSDADTTAVHEALLYVTSGDQTASKNNPHTKQEAWLVT